MSQRAFEWTKEARRLCESCKDRKARFRYRGVVRADREHTLCFECFRAERERRRARLLAEVPRATSGLRVGDRGASASDIEHRWRMLAHVRTVAGGLK